jgi:ParB family transcriptional regulator, chromosome partitioning protein
MSTVVSISPFECKMWEMHDRMMSYITEKGCSSEIESVSKHRQLLPVLGRTLKDDPHYKVELIYGARRLFVARHLNIQLLVELRRLSDVEAIIAMDIENRVRKDVSPYERGLAVRSL